jgi:hypothetical protein
MTDMTEPERSQDVTRLPDAQANTPERDKTVNLPAAKELGGPKGPEPTRYGDWERKGRCIDF